MKKLTTLMCSLEQKKRLASIDTIEKYQLHVNEHLKQFAGYSEDMAKQLSQSLLESSGNNIQNAIIELQNFQMHG